MDSLKPSHFFSGYFWIYRAIKPMDYDQLKREKNHKFAAIQHPIACTGDTGHCLSSQLLHHFDSSCHNSLEVDKQYAHSPDTLYVNLLEEI
ncbi:MAG: hypothetical protein GY821_09785 [Gammaproteobacteria bacterium]|nr:hypothetical protein [Gammaproteobacteria bacterium]